MGLGSEVGGGVVHMSEGGEPYIHSAMKEQEEEEEDDDDGSWMA